MRAAAYFSEDYAGARRAFVAAAEAAGLRPATHEHPEPGPDGEALCCDSLYVGPRHASKLLVLISGVHGVELMCGSGCQTGWLREGGHRALPDDTAVLLVHALNCWGAAHRRRNADGNIDLCRNFVDFGAPLPERPEYEAIHAAIACPELRGPARDAANETLARFRAEHGLEAFIGTLMGGQYRHPDGFSYGGREPCWSNRLITELLTRHGGAAREVVIVEYHSGLGPYAYGTAVTMHTGGALERARACFGGWVLAPNAPRPHGGETGHTVYGHTTEGYVRALPAAELTSIVLEYGTYPPLESLPVMLDDHWLTLHGDPQSPQGRAIRERLLELHHPRDDEWRQSIWERSAQVIRQSLRALSRQ